MLISFAAGALLMLYCQLCESMWLRPKRGRVFYGIAAFSAAIFILSTVSIGGRFRFAEMIYIENRMYEDGPKAWYLSNSDRWENVMTMSRCVLIIPLSVSAFSSACSIVAIPWIGDLLMVSLAKRNAKRIQNLIFRQALPSPCPMESPMVDDMLAFPDISFQCR
jgi:hypothetical protein